MLLLVFAIGLALVVKTFFVQSFYIPSESMEPGLIVNDRILVQKPSYWGSGGPQRGDVIVFDDPGGWLNGLESAQPMSLLARGLAGVDMALLGHRGHNGTLMLALKVGAFASEEQFMGAAERLSGQIGMSPPAPGFDAVLLPGQPELRMRERRIVEGIPLAQSTWDEIAVLAAELGVSM